jgi:hypothetical protein
LQTTEGHAVATLLQSKTHEDHWLLLQIFTKPVLHPDVVLAVSVHLHADHVPSALQVFVSPLVQSDVDVVPGWHTQAAFSQAHRSLEHCCFQTDPVPQLDAVIFVCPSMQTGSPQSSEQVPQVSPLLHAWSPQ